LHGWFLASAIFFLLGARNLESTYIHNVIAEMPITKKIRSDLILIRKISKAMANRIVAIVIITSQRCAKFML
jgi:hypothetical protein